MRVLSLFDGISCARASLERANLPISTYYASEIDKNAIKVSSKNYPDIIQLGSVVGLTPPENIDLLIGGSPCTDLSIAKKERQGLEGSQSSLFWEYVRIKKECNPKWFVLENVASMPKKDRDIITAEMGVEPVMFNASLVSAQCRKRLFWTNIPFTLPEDKGILLKDILQPDAEVDERMTVMGGKSACLDANYHKGSSVEHSIAKKVRTQVKFTPTAQTGRNETKKLGYVGENDHQAKRVYDDQGKLPALNVACNSMVKLGYIGEGEQYGQGGQAHRVYSPDGKTPTLSSGGPLVKLGHIGNTDSQGQRVYSPEGKGVTLSANGGGGGAKMGLYSVEQRIRKLTPIECERLQGLPDDYTSGIAMTQRYKCLGNAFNVDVVAHILRNLAEVVVVLGVSV
jgi:DNA (cytosine-5)-methyltransferase 3A